MLKYRPVKKINWASPARPYTLDTRDFPCQYPDKENQARPTRSPHLRLLQPIIRNSERKRKSQDAAELLKKLTDDLDKSVKNVDLQARFVTAVSDLQYLGCIRPHHKKADHVTRLIFGM